jgi:5-methylcytosine-specific restriction endonuclease McrA
MGWTDLEARRAYCRKNRDKINACNRRNHAKHREKRLIKKREDYAANREERIQEKRLSRAKNPDKGRLASKLYRQAHPEIGTASTKRKRAHKKGAPLNDLTHAQWLEIQAAQDYRCYYCGKRRKGHLTQDHIIPLSKGGSHTLSNVVAACRSCNSKKHTGPPPIPVQPLLLTIAPAKKKKAS